MTLGMHEAQEEARRAREEAQRAKEQSQRSKEEAAAEVQSPRQHA